jgi:cell wall-associated NlpC family hydrolase
MKITNWNKFGTRQKVAMLGDVLTFTRKSGGHVGIYVGEDDVCYHILGGNQSNMVNITRIAKNRLSQIRRTSWKIAQPANVRVIKLNPNGFISENEA